MSSRQPRGKGKEKQRAAARPPTRSSNSNRQPAVSSTTEQKKRSSSSPSASNGNVTPKKKRQQMMRRLAAQLSPEQKKNLCARTLTNAQATTAIMTIERTLNANGFNEQTQLLLGRRDSKKVIFANWVKSNRYLNYPPETTIRANNITPATADETQQYGFGADELHNIGQHTTIDVIEEAGSQPSTAYAWPIQSFDTPNYTTDRKTKAIWMTLHVRSQTEYTTTSSKKKTSQPTLCIVANDDMSIHKAIPLDIILKGSDTVPDLAGKYIFAMVRENEKKTRYFTYLWCVVGGVVPHTTLPIQTAFVHELQWATSKYDRYALFHLNAITQKLVFDDDSYSAVVKGTTVTEASAQSCNDDGTTNGGIEYKLSASAVEDFYGEGGLDTLLSLSANDNNATELQTFVDALRGVYLVLQRPVPKDSPHAPSIVMMQKVTTESVRDICAQYTASNTVV